MVLTTLDGEWFLDDMCLMTEVSIKLASYILSPTLLESNPGIHLVTKCLDLLHGIYKRLQVLLVMILIWCLLFCQVNYAYYHIRFSICGLVKFYLLDFPSGIERHLFNDHNTGDDEEITCRR